MRAFLILIVTIQFSCNNIPDQAESIETPPKIILENLTSNGTAKEVPLMKISLAKRFEFMHPDNSFEDTLILKTSEGMYEISPTGLFKVINGDTVQLETKVIVEEAFIFQDTEYYYLFFTETDHEGATSLLHKIEKQKLTIEHTEQIVGFNLGQPIIYDGKAYVTAIGFIGRLNLATGEYDWKHDGLYDHNKYSFNSFDTVMIGENHVEFISENYSSQHLDKVIVEKETGEIVELFK